MSWTKVHADIHPQVGDGCGARQGSRDPSAVGVVASHEAGTKAATSHYHSVMSCWVQRGGEEMEAPVCTVTLEERCYKAAARCHELERAPAFWR